MCHCSTSGFIHSVVATGLEPSTTYYYVVGSAPDLLCAPPPSSHGNRGLALVFVASRAQQLLLNIALRSLIRTLYVATASHRGVRRAMWAQHLPPMVAGPRSSHSRPCRPSAPGQHTCVPCSLCADELCSMGSQCCQDVYAHEHSSGSRS